MNPLTDSRKRFAKLLGVGALAGTLAACGGGVYVDIPIDDRDLPPEVTLHAETELAFRGDPVLFEARALDDFVVDRVELWQSVPGRADIRLDVDTRAPYEWDVTMPVDLPSGSVVAFYARAIDDSGQDGFSRSVLVSLR